MGGIALTIQQLLLDVENPRIIRANGQREVLQKIIEDQGLKIVVLAKSITINGLNPMDRWLVVKSAAERGRYIVLEGNRRLAALRVLQNPAVLNDLEVKPQIAKRLSDLSGDFKIRDIEPIDCFDVDERESATIWLNQRHTGQNKGEGIVNWEGVQTSRFRGREPALQALDLVYLYGTLTSAEQEIVEDSFPITTLGRLLGSPAVRSKIGVEIVRGKLKTELPPDEVIRPLRRIALDLASKTVNVTKLKLVPQMVKYVSELGDDLPDLRKCTGTLVSVDEWTEQDFTSAPSSGPAPPQPNPPGPPPGPAPSPPSKKPRLVPRIALIPRTCNLTVSNAKIAKIVKELRGLPLETYPHAISVLFRVFLEQSVDHYLTAGGVSLTDPASGREKKLRPKVADAINLMVASGVPRKDLAGVEKGIDDTKNPLHIDTLHFYVHNRFYSPKQSDLEVAWDNAQLFFEKIWK